MNAEQFNSITFNDRNDRYAQMGRHLKGVFVPKQEFELMWRRASDSLPNLSTSSRLTAKAIYADHSWDTFPLGKRIALGRVLCFFVEQGVIPLRLVNPDKRGPRKYVRILTENLCNSAIEGR